MRHPVLTKIANVLTGAREQIAIDTGSVPMEISVTVDRATWHHVAELHDVGMRFLIMDDDDTITIGDCVVIRRAQR